MILTKVTLTNCTGLRGKIKRDTRCAYDAPGLEGHPGEQTNEIAYLKG